MRRAVGRYRGRVAARPAARRRRNRASLLAILTLSAAATLLLLSRGRTGDTGQDIVFSVSSDAFPFVRDAINASATDLERVLDCLALWKIHARALEPATGGAARYRVSFLFAEPERTISRVFAVSAIVTAGGPPPVARQTEFTSLTMEPVDPVILSRPDGADCLPVLARALDTDRFDAASREWLTSGPIRQVTFRAVDRTDGAYRLGVHRGGGPEEPPEESRFFTVSTDDRGSIDVEMQGL